MFAEVMHSRKAVGAHGNCSPGLERSFVRNRTGLRLVMLVLSVIALFRAEPSEAQQDLGHKMLGTIGLKAGFQPLSGLYIADRLLSYGAGQLIDRNGLRIPLNVDLDALANGIGISLTYELPHRSTFMNFSIAAPVAHVTLHTDRLEASLDNFGLGDLYVQPLKLGWRMNRVQIVSGYAFYVPTGRFEPGGRGGVGLGQWTHEFSLGSTVYFDRAKTWLVSALASYNLNGRKRGIDITRGDTIQVQGGAGKTLSRIIDAGLAGYALWQARDDRGADLPQVFQGARDRAWGLGPEINIRLAPIRSRMTLRYEHDVAVNSRPLGQILVFDLAFQATH